MLHPSDFDYLEGLPARKKDGKFYILILTSGRILRWPYRKESDPPMYETRKDAAKVLKRYVRFANNMDRTRIKRTIEEFEVVEFTGKASELNT